jgi:hypothetical protein
VVEEEQENAGISYEASYGIGSHEHGLVPQNVFS